MYTGPYDLPGLTLKETREAKLLWSPRWEVWPEENTKSGRLVYPVYSERRPVLFALRRADAQLAANAPGLYDAVLRLLDLFDVRDHEPGMRNGRPVITQRELDRIIGQALRTMAKARGVMAW
jgi:hypothetical protein